MAAAKSKQPRRKGEYSATQTTVGDGEDGRSWIAAAGRTTTTGDGTPKTIGRRLRAKNKKRKYDELMRIARERVEEMNADRGKLR